MLNKILLSLLFLLFLTGCGPTGEADPLYATWTLTRVTGGIAGSGRPVTGTETLTLVPGNGLWRYPDGRVETFTYQLETRGDKRVLVRETRLNLIEQPSVFSHLTLTEDAADGFTYEFDR